jgi:SRSO17 transposase
MDRFDEYVAKLTAAVGHADRRDPLRGYVSGLLLPGDRKSIEPMAAKLEPRRVRARHQSLHHLIANAPWDDREVIRVAREFAVAQFGRHGGLGAWVVDDSGIPKKGKHSVGVARQYCGVLGKQDNCQVAVSISIVNDLMSVPAAYRLYLPEIWAKDRERRRVAGVPDDIEFRTKWQIALDEIDRLLAEEVPRAPVVADAGYGDTTEFRDSLTERGLTYAVGIKADTTFWPPGTDPLPPRKYSGTGRPPTLLRRTRSHRPLSARQIATDLSAKAWRTVTWADGTRGQMRSRFAAVRVRAAHRDYWSRTPRPVEWLIIEWPEGDPEPTKYWLSSMGEGAALKALVRLAKMRWRIERDYQELKDEIGLDHYEGRGWRGFHHHGALCIAAYAFLAAERARLSPPEPLEFLKAAPLPKGFRPRGSPGST